MKGASANRLETRAQSQFVNRIDEFQRLTCAVESAVSDGRPAVVVLHGQPGIGKSALAKKWVDGWTAVSATQKSTVHVELNSYRDNGVVAIADVLSDILLSIGYGRAQIPSRLPAKVAALRRSTSAECIALLIDDAWHGGEVRPFIPSSTESVLIATSQRTLSDLVLDGADHLAIGPFSAEHSRELLQVVVGQTVELAGTTVEKVVVDRCQGLPLAIAISGARIRTDSRRNREAFATAMAEGSALKALRLDDDISLNGVLTRAYLALSTSEQQAYRLLGLLPAAAWRLGAAAAALGVREDYAGDLIDRLVNSRVVDEDVDRSDGYRVHALIREHAADVCRRVEPAPQIAMAQTRIIRYYRDHAWALDHSLHPDRLRLSLNGTSHGSMPQAEVLDDFDYCRSAFRAVQQQALTSGLPDEAAAIAEALWPLFHARGYHQDALAVFEAGCVGARVLGRPALEARLLAQVARTHAACGELSVAAERIREAVELAERSGESAIFASALEWRGVIELERHAYSEAEASLRLARNLATRLGLVRAVAIADYHLAQCYYGRKQSPEALQLSHSALLGLSETDDARLWAQIHVLRADLLAATGRHRDAISAAATAAQSAASIGDHTVEAQARMVEARAQLFLDDRAAAVTALRIAEKRWASVRDHRLAAVQQQLSVLSA